MKTKANKSTLIPKMYCALFGHNYKITKRVTYHVKEYTCEHCKKQLTTNSNGLLVELTPKYKEINAILERIHHTKTKRLKSKLIVSPI